MEDVEFESSGQKLKGTIFYPKTLKETNPAILFIHGWTSVKERSYQYAAGLAELGFISLLFDMRGHGVSEGDLSTLTSENFLNDDIVAYDYLSVVKGVDKENISVIGSSLGGYLAALLTAKRKTKNAVLRAPADYPNDLFDKPKAQFTGDNPNIMRWRKQSKKHTETFALQALHDFRGNVLIIESEKDDSVPRETVQNYVNAVIEKNKLTHIVMKDAPHSIQEGKFRDEVENILTEWFKKNAV